MSGMTEEEWRLYIEDSVWQCEMLSEAWFKDLDDLVNHQLRLIQEKGYTVEQLIREFEEMQEPGYYPAFREGLQNLAKHPDPGISIPATCALL